VGTRRRSTAQPSYEVKTAAERGTNSISNFDHHNINEGAVDNTHDSTGRILVRDIYEWTEE
jgi:hypothetical protein